jgi:WD40 repeat protein
MVSKQILVKHSRIVFHNFFLLTDLLPRRTTYKLVRPAENCSSLAVSGAIHILHKNVDNGKMYEYEKQTATQTDQNNVTTEYLTGPLILVAWNNSSTFKTECLCLYNLLNKKFLIRYNLPELTQNLEFLVKDRSEAKVALTKVAHITSSYADQKHILYVGFDYFDEDGTICGSFTSVFEISDNDIDYASKNSPGKDDAGKEKNESKYPTMVKKIPMDAPISLHDHQLTCLHLDRKGKTLLSGSYDKTFSISNLDNKFAMARDMEDRLLIEKPIKKLLAPTHVDTVLAVAPSDVPYAMFTSSSDATIRYWKKLVNKKLWTSYQFPLDHVKRVGCLAFAVISFHKKDNGADKTSKPQTLESRFVECLKTLQCEDNNDEPLKKELTGKILISGSLDHRVIVWDVNNPVKPIVAKYLVGHEDEVISVKVMNEPFPTVVSAGRDRMIRFWDLLSGDCFRKLDHASMINELDLVRVYRVGGDKTLRHSTDCDLGEVVAISSEQGVICWSFLSNHRMNVQYSDPVVSLASFPSENSNPLVFLGTSTSEIVISNDSIRVGEVKLTTFPNPQASNERFQKDKVRVNSLLSVEFPQGKGKFLLAGLANGFLSIVKVTGNELKEIAFFNTTMKNIFSLTQGIFRWKSNNSTTVIRNLLFIGGMADKEGNTLQVWDLKKLLTEVEETDDVSKEIDYDEALKARKVDFPHLKDPVYNIAVHAMNSMIVTADEARNVIVWRVYPNVEFKPLYSLEGLHTSHAIMNLQIFNPCLAWESAATGGKKGYLRNVEWQIEYTDEDNEVKYEKYNLAECDLVFTSGYDGKIGVWPIKLRDPPIPTSTQSTPVVNGSPTRGVGFTLPSKSSSVSVKLNAMSRSQSQILPPEPPSPADGSKPSYVTLSTKCTDDRYYYLAKPFNSMQHDNAQGVTSMIIFAPQGGENINPLLLTGSIDNFIYVWDVYTQEKLRVLTCHSNRVNSLLTYYADGKNSVVLVSGSDDGSAVFWKDGLQHHLFPPSKHSIARSFYNDVLTPGCWQHIKALKATCETLFWEFPHLFYLALIERQETFFIEFIEDLKQVITRIPGYPRSEGNNCCRWMHHVPEGPVDILEYAMHTNALVALRAILLAWIHVLNKDIDDSLNQSVLVATRTFNEKNLLELATNFPVEYTEFLTSLRLIRAHRTAPSVADNLIRVIPHGKRLVVVGSNSFPLDKQFRKEQDPHRKTFTSIFEEINTKYYQQSKFPQGREFCGLLKDLNTVWLRSVSSVLTEIYDRWMAFKAFAVHGKEVHEQAVMPFMIPIKRFVDIRQFHSAIQTSEILKRMDLFESDIVLAAITHYWNVYGWKIYMLNFIQYAFTIFMFVYSIYSYQRVVHMDRPNEEDLSRSLAATGGFMFFMTWYAIDEFFQVAGKFIKFHKYNLSNRRGFHIVVQHFFFDMWNVIDCSVVICGLMGASGLYKELKFCQDENHYVTSTTGGSPYCDVSRQSTATMSCLLAATAVLLWFKVLYYLRPSKEAGQFGK